MNLFVSLLVSVLSLNAFADIVKPLPKSERLAQVAKAIGTQLSDGNIASGTTSLWAGKLKTKVDLKDKNAVKALAQKGFAEAFKYDTEEALPAGTKLTVTVKAFKDGDSGDVSAMTDAYMESNDYADNKEIRDAGNRYMFAVLRQLPVNKSTVFVHVTTNMMDTSSEERRNIQYFLVVNPGGKAVQFFTVQGSM